MSHLSEIIYGGMDGIITTVVLISASLGSGISNRFIPIIGSASLIGDGFSMGVSRYNSLIESKDSSCKTGKTNAIISGMYTFFSFIFLGVIPLLPFLFIKQQRESIRYFIFLALFSFGLLGYIKGKKTNTVFSNATKTIILGTVAVALSYYISIKLKEFL
tara:strand:- start:836 stop:1315 length:480 start_codon:yes stop_codon:yes gene_type:complete